MVAVSKAVHDNKVLSTHHLGTRRRPFPLAACVRHLLCIPFVLAGGLAPDARASGEGGRTHALLVGCSEYPDLAERFPDTYETSIKLTGPVNDVALLRRALIDVLAVDEADITVLAGWPEEADRRPTRRNILRHLERLTKIEGVGQRVVIYLAGHGSQQKDARQGPEEPDGLDEVFLPADVRAVSGGSGRIPNAISDDELGRQVRRIRDAGAEVWLIVDACHSGTLLRSAPGLPDAGNVRLRQIPAEVLGVGSREPAGEAGTLRGGSRGRGREATELGAGSMDRIAAMYGAQSYGSAPEMELPTAAHSTAQHGLFTYLLVQELTRTRGRTTFQQLGDRIVAAYQAFPCDITIPVAEGDLSREVCSGEARSGFDLLVSVLADGRYRLNAGRLAGIEPGTRLALFAEDEAVAGHAEVAEADLHESICRVSDGGGGDPGRSYRAKLTHRPFGEARIKLALMDGEGRALDLEALPADMRASLDDESSPCVLVADARQADWYVIPEGATWRLRPAVRTGGCDRPGLTRAAFRTTLDRLVHARNLKQLAAGALTNDLGQDVVVWLERRTGGQGEPEVLSTGARLHPGDELRVMLRKPSPEIYDVGVFFIDANSQVHPLFPRPREIARLEQAATAAMVLVDWVPVTDDALGIEHLAVFAFPREAASEVVPVRAMAEPFVQTRGGGAAGDWVRELQRALRGEQLRGAAIAAPEIELPQSSLITLQTAWPELGPPAWPERGVFDGPGRPNCRGLDSLPVALPAAARGAFVRSAGCRNHDAFLEGDGVPRTVWLDLDGGVRSPSGPEALSEFDPEAAFHFGSDAWVAYYDSDHDGAFDIGLIDRDRDAVADERWDLGPAGWQASHGGGAPWLSQAHVSGFVRDAARRTEVSKRFGLLVRSEDRAPGK